MKYIYIADKWNSNTRPTYDMERARSSSLSRCHQHTYSHRA